ncbi:unnamed protein product [Phytophthora fragariaefolia]|uniref:Unnamed protein product n=1 Tax=Phytophthora fragariaefolia TaxID=1490495 RepID=A0A9W7D6R0_9STRA|nr:unnamed protein product [Phytophthora fragariaefolia]
MWAEAAVTAQSEEKHELEFRTGGAGGGAAQAGSSSENLIQQIEHSTSDNKASRKRVKMTSTQVPRKKFHMAEQVKPSPAISPVSDIKTAKRKKREIAARRKRSSERCATSNEGAENQNSGRCMTPTVQQDDKQTEVNQSSTLEPGEIATARNEKLDADGDSRLDDVTVSDPRDTPRSMVPKTGCRDLKLRKKKTMDWWQDFCCLTASVNNDPETLDDALSSENSEKWHCAADTEYHALMKNGTWKLLHRQKGMKELGNRLIFRVKYRPNGEIERFKARLVVKGFMQVYGLDYLEVYSPAVRLETLRVLSTLAAI